MWPKLKTPIPAHLPALIIASLIAFILNNNGFNIATIGSRFHFVLGNGVSGSGIPSALPHFELPWLLNDVGTEVAPFGWFTVIDLIPSAFAIAMLGAIESMLCAVVLDGMSGKRHSANSELLGQGIGNIVTPFFGGITATAAIARSAANFKAGAQSPVSAMVHALVVLLAIISLAPVLKYLPMPALAGLLLMVAWNMSEAPKSVRMLKTSPTGDIAVFILCISLTVWFDMVIAITTGIVFASILFMREIANMTRLVDITTNKRFITVPISPNWKIFKVNGPLFFAAADRVFSEINEELKQLDGVVLYLEAVPILDAGGLAALSKLMAAHAASGKKILFAEWQFQPLKTLAKAKVKPVGESINFFASLEEALASPQLKTDNPS